MAEERVQRRLAAILAADVVGYSRLMEQNEAGTLAALRHLRRSIVNPLVTEHDGRVVKEPVDLRPQAVRVSEEDLFSEFIGCNRHFSSLF